MTSGLEGQLSRWLDARDQVKEGKLSLPLSGRLLDGPPYCGVVYDQRVVKTRLPAGHHGIRESSWAREALVERNFSTRI